MKLSEQANIRAVKKMYEDFNNRDMNECWSLLSEDFVWVDPFGNKHDRKGIRAFYDNLLLSFPDLKVWENRIISQGDTVVSEFYESMTHKGEFLGVPPTNKKVEFQGAEFYEFKDGRIKHITNYCNPNRIVDSLRG